MLESNLSMSFPFCRPITHAAAAAAAALLLFAFAPLAPAVYADALPAFAPNARTLKEAARDADVETLPGGYVAVLPKPFAAPTPTTDPRYQWRFARAAYVYAPVRPGFGRYAPAPGIGLVVMVHYQPEDEKRARKTARLCARLLRLHRDRFGRDATFPRDADVADIWLAPETPPGALEAGGETRDSNVYVFATDAQRSPIEWVRTVAHEWGHLTMAAARGFTLPENDAGGFLGERLYIKWLREDRTPAPEDDGVTRDGLNLYWERQIGPLMDRFTQAGPYAKALMGSGPDAMDLYIGGVLSCDAALGSAVTGRALHSIEGVRPKDFFDAVRRVVSEVTWGASLPVHLPGWVPLERGRYSVSGTALWVPAPTWRYLKAPAQAMLRRAPTAGQQRREAMATAHR